MVSGKRLQHRLVQSAMVTAILLAACSAMAAVNVKLSGTLPPGGDVKLFKVSPDGRYAVFLADARVDGIPELFSTHISDGVRNPLTPSLSAGAAVLGFDISPDGRYVVYWTGPVIGPKTGLYAVPITGGERVDLFGAVDPGAEVKDVEITPDSQHVIYVSKKITDPPGDVSEQNLWAITISGGSPVKIFGPVCEWCSIKFKVIPDGSGLVYLIGYKAGEPELHAANFAGMDVLLATRSADFFITPDGERVVYWEYYAGKVLSSVQITGGGAEVLVGIPYEATFEEIKISPDSKYVVYLSDQLFDERLELFSVPVDGSEDYKRLTVGMIEAGDVVDYQITPNSQGVVYRADKEVNGRIDLYAVTMNGSAFFKLNGTNGNVTRCSITPNSLGAVFLADKNLDGKNELFSVYINGTGLRLLNPILPAGGEVSDFLITPNNLGVVYRSDQEMNDVFNLYLVSLFGGTPIKINGPLVDNGDVSNFAITPDGKGVVYLADQETDGVYELYVTLDRQVIYLPLVLR